MSYGNSTDNKILNADFIESELYILMQNSDGVELLSLETAPAHVDTDATYLTHLDRNQMKAVLELVNHLQGLVKLQSHFHTLLIILWRWYCNVSGSGCSRANSIISQTDGGNSIVVSGDLLLLNSL